MPNLFQQPAIDNIPQTIPIAAYIVAGGGSTRFGRDKARATLAGQPMLTRMCDLLSAVTASIHIIAPPSRYEFATAPVIPDRWPGGGPLGGIITALLHTSEQEPDTTWNLIISCDLPFVTPEFLTYLRDFAQASSAKAIVPESSQGREPLCACWHTSAALQLQSAFESGMRRVNDALKLVNAEVLDESHWKRFDSAGRLFWNMNTPKDYAEAQRIEATEHT
jgi:molybdopterin-guanine dinucleotide biosynthesis protein A